MAKRKSPENRREWTLKEIKRIRYLRDKKGMSFPEIGLIMGEDYNKCRTIYHTGRYADKKKSPSIKSICEKLGVSRYRYNRMEQLLWKLNKPRAPEDVEAALRLSESKK